VTDQDDVYERMIKPIEDQMIRSVWRVVRNSEDVNDAFQDALAGIWKRWGRIQNHANPRALILRICIHAAYDNLRRKARERKSEALEAMIADPAGGAADRIEAEERKTALCAAISRLPKTQGLAVHLRFIEEQSYEAIARALGCREISARKLVSRAVKKLRMILQRQTNEISVL